MALGRDRKRINVKGGGLLKIRELDPTATDTFSDLGYLTSVQLLDEHTMVDEIPDSGEFIDSWTGAQHAQLIAVLDQTSIDEINLRKLSANKYYDVYYYCPTSQGYYQEISAPICKINPGADLTFQSATKRQITLTIHCLSPQGAFTRTPTAFNVVKGVPYVITENSTAYNAPTDTAATLWNAVK